ncbi:hypothetical protein HDV00_006099 [Rhizophlyctis rosea]|nr:hypothetical protein HDV00_006099 [Rhizophlyctis rosea]
MFDRDIRQRQQGKGDERARGAPGRAAERPATRFHAQRKQQGGGILSARNLILAVAGTVALIYFVGPDKSRAWVRQRLGRAPTLSNARRPFCSVGKLLLSSKQVTQDKATGQCQANGGKLADITNKTFGFAADQVLYCGGKNTAAWVNSYYGDNYGGSPIALTAGGNAGPGSINMYSDGQKRYALCWREVPVTSPAVTAQPAASAPSSEVYFLTVPNLNRASADAACVGKGGKLADINKANYNYATTVAFDSVGGQKKLWINSWDGNSYVGSSIVLALAKTAPGGSVNGNDGNEVLSALCASSDPPVPLNYELVFGPVDQVADSTAVLSTTPFTYYDVSACAKMCDATPKTALCDFFNVFSTKGLTGSVTYSCVLYQRVADSATVPATTGTTITSSRGYRKINYVIDGGFESAVSGVHDDTYWSFNLTNWYGYSAPGAQENAIFFWWKDFALHGSGVAVLGSGHGIKVDVNALTLPVRSYWVHKKKRWLKQREAWNEDYACRGLKFRDFKFPPEMHVLCDTLAEVGADMEWVAAIEEDVGSDDAPAWIRSHDDAESGSEEEEEGYGIGSDWDADTDEEMDGVDG